MQIEITHAVYVGPDVGWNVSKGMTALIRDSGQEGIVLAQFDDFHAVRLGQDLAYGWHEFPSNHFLTHPIIP